MKDHARSRSFALSVLIFLQVFLGLQGLFGGGAFLLAPDGHLIQMPFSHLKNIPFSDFFIPGLLLFTFLGVYPIAIAYSLWKQPAWRWPDIIDPFKELGRFTDGGCDRDDMDHCPDSVDSSGISPHLHLWLGRFDSACDIASKCAPILQTKTLK